MLIWGSHEDSAWGLILSLDQNHAQMCIQIGCSEHFMSCFVEWMGINIRGSDILNQESKITQFKVNLWWHCICAICAIANQTSLNKYSNKLFLQLHIHYSLGLSKLNLLVVCCSTSIPDTERILLFRKQSILCQKLHFTGKARQK